MSRAELKKKAFSGFIWSFAEKAGSQLVGFIVTLLLARILVPNDFGLIAMATVFYAVARVLIDGGMRDSLIQQKNSTQKDYNAVFYFNAIAGIVLYLIIFFTAPLLSRFYGYPELTLVIRVLSINILVYAFVIVQMASLSKKLQFKLLMKISIPATIISGIAGLAAAWYGWGIWALVLQMVTESVLYTTFLWFVVRWTPTREFDWDIFRFHWKHGSRLVFIDILTVVYKNIYSLVIGKFFSASQLGFYNRADTFKVFTYNNTIGLIQNVSYPVLAQVQEDDEMLKRSYRKILQGTLLIVLPVCILLITLSEQIIEFLLTDKWLPAAPILSVLAVVNVLAPFNSINVNVLKIKRRTDLLMRVEILNKLILIVVVACSVMAGFTWLIWSAVLMAVIALFSYNYFANKLIRYSIIEQLRDLTPLLGAFIFSCFLTVFVMRFLNGQHLIVQLFAGSVVALGSYILIIFVFSRGLIKSILELLAPRLGWNKLKPTVDQNLN